MPQFLVASNNEISGSGFGSGVVIDPMGLVLTNYHVIHRAKELRVWFYDPNNNNNYLADVVAIDPVADLALIRMRMPEHKLPLDYLKIESENWDVGQEVVAIGHPLGIQWTVSLGHVANTTRSGKITPYVATIQHSAEIHKGNSGGPLINSEGDIIGINTYLLLPDQSWSGIAYAIRGDIVQWSVDQMLEKGEVKYPAMRLHIRLLTSFGVEYLNEKYPNNAPFPSNVYGLVVLEMEDGSWAQTHGMKLLDIVIAIDGEPVNHMLDVSNILMGNHYEPGRKISLLIIRDRHIKKIDYELSFIELDHLKFYDEANKKAEAPAQPDPEEKEEEEEEEKKEEFTPQTFPIIPPNAEE